MVGDVRLQSIGLATGTSTAKSTVAPAATFCAADVTGASAVPLGAVTTACTVTLCADVPWFWTLVCTCTVALLVDTVGVVTNVAHCATCTGSVAMMRTWREMAAPAYQREAGCDELLARTAITLPLPPNTACVVIS